MSEQRLLFDTFLVSICTSVIFIHQTGIRFEKTTFFLSTFSLYFPNMNAQYVKKI